MLLPPQVLVLVRDWLSGNNVVLQSRDGHVLVDSGYSTHAPLTLALVARVLDGAPLARLVNTHGHSDHVGGNAAIKQAYRCPIAFPDAEADLVDALGHHGAAVRLRGPARRRASASTSACARERRTCGATSNGACSRRPGTTWVRSSSTTPSTASSCPATRCGRTDTAS